MKVPYRETLTTLSGWRFTTKEGGVIEFPYTWSDPRIKQWLRAYFKANNDGVLPPIQWQSGKVYDYSA